MNSIMITLKMNMITTQNYYSVTLIVLYEIKTEDLYEHFSKEKERFKFSNYSAHSKYYDDSNKLVVSKMKNEIAGVEIIE